MKLDLSNRIIEFLNDNPQDNSYINGGVYLINKEFTFDKIEKAKKIIKKDFNPVDDVRASKEYRTKISQNLLERFFNEENNIKSSVY